jgi:hypothetical protein
MTSPLSSSQGGTASAVSPTVADAARLVACGVNVLPIRSGTKRPALSSWKRLQDESLYDADWDAVDRWLYRWWEGTGHQLGVVTGAVSGIVVVDVDDQAARDYVEAACGWPETVTARTAKGWHLWFRHPGGELGNRVAVAGVGLDARADRGYCVVPPSVHPSGHVYTWEVSPFDFLGGMWPPAEIPEALRRVLWEPPRPAKASRFPTGQRSRSGYVATALERETADVRGAAEGTRNDTLNRAAFSLARFVRAGELGEAEVTSSLLAATSLPEREATATIRSGLSRSA